MFIPDARSEFFHPGTWDTDLDFFVGDIVKFTRFEQPAMIEGKRYRTVAVYDLMIGSLVLLSNVNRHPKASETDYKK
jgi:hypothetical protein